MDIPDDALTRIISLKADLKLLEEVQQRLKELVHSYTCSEVFEECTTGIHICTCNCMESIRCRSRFTHCKDTKKLLDHIKSCKVIKNCPEPRCSSSRQILEHWQKCGARSLRDSCPLCTLPLQRILVSPKKWHSLMTIEERDHLTDLLHHMTLHMNYANKRLIRDAMMYRHYVTADSRAEYYHLLAEEVWRVERRSPRRPKMTE